MPQETQPQFDEKQVGRLKQLMTLLEPDAITKPEFLDAFKQVVAQIQKLKLSNEQDIAAMREHIQILSDKVTTDTNNNFANSKTEMMSLIQTALTNHDNRMAQMEARISLVKDGEKGLDADEKKIVQDVLAQIKLPEERAILMDGPDEIRNKLELLQGEERLSPEAIKGLEAFIKQFIPQRSMGGSAGWGAHPLAVQQSGTNKAKLARVLNFTGATVTHSAEGVTTVAVTSSGFTELSATETPNGSLKVFTFSSASAQPSYVVVDNVWMKATSKAGTVNWTYASGTKKVTLTIPANDDIFAIV